MDYSAPPIFSESHRYRSSNRGYLVMCGVIAGLGVIVWLLGPNLIEDGLVSQLIAACLVSYGVSVAIMMMVGHHYFWLYVTSDGIRSYDGLGLYHDVRWDQMRSTYRLILFPGISYTCVRHSAGGFAIVIPHFLNDFAQCRDNVLRLAPASNPLRARLENA